MIEIRKSPIHGYGVFATTDIKVGTVITYYDGKVLPNRNILSIEDDISDDDAYFIINNSSYAIPLYSNNNNSSLFEIMKLGNKRTDKAMYGYKYEQITDFNKVGSLINDGLWDGDIENYKKELPIHTKRNHKGNIQDFINKVFDKNGFLKTPELINCCFKNECIQRGIALDLYINKVEPLAVIAKRDIRKGEELLMIYGVGYWEEEEMNKIYMTDELINLIEYNYLDDNFVVIRNMLKMIKTTLLEK